MKWKASRDCIIRKTVDAMDRKASRDCIIRKTVDAMDRSYAC